MLLYHKGLKIATRGLVCGQRILWLIGELDDAAIKSSATVATSNSAISEQMERIGC